MLNRPQRPAHRLADITRRVDELAGGAIDDSGDTPVHHFGRVACVKELRLRFVPFFEPCVIVVLSGTKHLGEQKVEAGGCLAIPAPSRFHMGNEPGPDSGHYKAMVFSFDAEDIQYVRASIPQTKVAGGPSKAIVPYAEDDATLEALDHYLQSSIADSPARVMHRKREILLVLAERDPRILELAHDSAPWAQKLRALFSEAPANAWPLRDVCRDLAVSESTLRRHLARENTTFREVLSEFRLANALMQVLMTRAPLYQIAYDNGFRSVSRFSENFRKRYGHAPSHVRSRLSETG